MDEPYGGELNRGAASNTCCKDGTRTARTLCASRLLLGQLPEYSQRSKTKLGIKTLGNLLRGRGKPKSAIPNT